MARYDQLAERARLAGQEHIFRHWEQLEDSQRDQLLHQVASIDFDRLQTLTETYIHASAATQQRARLQPIRPIPIPSTPEQKKTASEMRHHGEAALRNGKIGCLLVAGGQGSRLGFNGPKGIYPITPVKHKSLFQLHAEKLLAVSRRYGAPIPWYIMTSESNDTETRRFFHKHHYFGLAENDIFFFTQGMVPALDAQGKLILDEPGHIFMNPDGHGGVLNALQRSGALANLRQRGIEHLFYFQIDNVLLQMCDPLYLGYHLHNQADMSAKVVAKRDAFEKVGVIGKIDDRLGVIEYSDLSDEDKQATGSDGKLLYNAGSIAIHVIAVDFIRAIVEKEFSLPWHVAHKKIPYLNEMNELVTPDQPNGYKFETFIFDALTLARRSVILEVDRALEFSPVKNAEGEDSPQTARRDLTRLYANWLQQAGMRLPEDGLERLQVEISPLYALDADELCRKFLSSGVIEREFYLG